MTAALVVPSDWSEITPAWLASALNRHHPDAVVDTVTVDMRDDGTNRRARLAVTYAAGSGPATVFVKAVDPDHKAMIKLTSGLLHEPRLFNSNIALPLEHPLVYAAPIDEEAEEFLLVMEDLNARGADPRDATRPLTPAQATNGVRGLARMHGRYWGARVERPELDWLEPFVPWDGMEYAPLPAALERLGDDAPAAVHALSIEDRRRNERSILEAYRDALGLPADEMPSLDEIWLRYRASVAHGLTLWLCTASAGELWQRPDIALVLAQRYSAAYEDLQTAAAIADLL
jgi:hypothetical protein